jgi:alcohol-forming fatty acyl-CoA reductase
LAEQVAYDYRDKIPIVVMRPSIIMNAVNEPIPGWVEGISNGITSLNAGALTGLIRTLYSGELQD